MKEAMNKRLITATWNFLESKPVETEGDQQFPGAVGWRGDRLKIDTEQSEVTEML